MDYEKQVRILAKQLSPEVKTLSGWIVYVVDENENPLEAEICSLEELTDLIKKLQKKINKLKSVS